MAPKIATTSSGKMHDEVVVVVLLMALKSSGGSLGPWCKDMSALHGSRSDSGFEHSLRSANKLANELLNKKKKGDKLEPADLGRSVSDNEPLNSTRKRKASDNKAEDSTLAVARKKTQVKKGRSTAMHQTNEDDEDGSHGKAKVVDDEN